MFLKPGPLPTAAKGGWDVVKTKDEAEDLAIAESSSA
jgi:hypothetical protein